MKLLTALSTGALVLGLGACSKKLTAGPETATTISGALSLPSLQTNAIQSGDLNWTPSSTITDYKVRCVTLAGTPQAGEGACNSSGVFSLSLLVESGAPIGCFVMESSNIVATVVFESATASLNAGSTSRAGSFAANSGASALEFGTIAVNPSTGQAVVTTSNIVQTGGSAIANTSWTEPTGVWNYQMVCDSKLMSAEIYSACQAMLADSNNNDKTRGKLAMHQYSASKSGSPDIYGLALWDASSGTSARAGCAGEGVTELPTGYTANQAILTTAMSFSVPTPTDIVPRSGANICGFSFNGSLTCDATTNSGSHGPSGGTFSNDDCKAICVAQNIWEHEDNSACPVRPDVRWNFWADSSSVNKLAYSAGVYGNGSYEGWIKFNRPDRRFVFGPMEIQGKSASVYSTEYRQESQWTGSGNIDCNIIREEKITIFQRNASNMRAEVVSTVKLGPNSSVNCDLSNWGDNSEAFYVDLTK